MKVCVLAIPRSSSTSLFQTINEVCEFNVTIGEPFNTILWSKTDIERNIGTLNTEDSLSTKLLFMENSTPDKYNFSEYIE